MISRAGLTAMRQVGPILLLLVVWQVAVVALHVPEWLLPPPTTIAGGLIANSGVLLSATLQTVSEAVAGFIGGNLLAVAGAFLLVRWSSLRTSVLPLAVGLRSVPLVAIAPVLTLLFGFGSLTMVVMASLLTFFPALVNGMVGLEAVSADQIRLFRSLAASDWLVFRRLRIPVALPYLFAAFKVTAPASVLGAMVAEWAASNGGLGYVILDAADAYRLGLMWAAVAVATLVALLAFVLASVAERRVIFWPVTA